MTATFVATHVSYIKRKKAKGLAILTSLVKYLGYDDNSKFMALMNYVKGIPCDNLVSRMKYHLQYEIN